MTRPLLSLAFAFLAGVFPEISWGKVFTNDYVQFELPSGWDCRIEGSEWVCQSNDPEIKKEAIVICAAKQRGPEDELSKYEEHLKKSRAKTDLAKNPYSSEVVWLNTITVNGQSWIDALHKGSEIPGFYTRYLATVKDKVAMLLTWSVSFSSYQKMSQEMKTFVNSLKALDVTGTAVATGAGFEHESILGSDPLIPAGDAVTPAASVQEAIKTNIKPLIGAAIIALALIGLVIVKRRKKP